MSKKIPPETAFSKNPEKREKFLNAYKLYKEGRIKSIEDLAVGLRMSKRSVYMTLNRLEYEDGLKPIEEEVIEEELKKFEIFAVQQADKDKLLYTSPIPKVRGWINEWLSQKRPRTRRSYIDYAGRCWKYIVEHHALYEPEQWTYDEVKEFMYNPKMRLLSAATQNNVRSGVNSLMKYLGKRDIHFPDLKTEDRPVVHMSDQTKAAFFKACKEEYPEKGIIPFTIGMILQKTGTRIGTDKGRDPKNPLLDRGVMCIRTRAIDLSRKPVRMRVRDKWNLEWTKFLDEEAEKYIREYLAWRAKNRRQWKDNPFLFGTTTYTQSQGFINKIKKKYNLYELDEWGQKRWIHWHMFRHNFANECLIAMVGELKEGEELEMGKGVLACCQLGGWKTTDTFVDKYLTQTTLNRIRELAFAKVKGKITLGL